MVHTEHLPQQEISCFPSSQTGNELLQRFWQVESCDFQSPHHSLDEQVVVDHFHTSHRRDQAGRFVVPRPRKENAVPLGEMRSLAVQRFLRLERSLWGGGKFDEFAGVIEEYFQKGHAEQVPSAELHRPCKETFYLPMHTVYKASSTTKKLRVVFDAFAKSSTEASLNDQLLVGPTVHASLINVLLRFCRHRIASTTDIS